VSQAAAKILLETVLRHVTEQDAALARIEAMCSPQEFQTYKLMVGRSMGEMLLEIINPIIAQFPDLRPPEMHR
jgi:hypothetical protein